MFLKNFKTNKKYRIQPTYLLMFINHFWTSSLCYLFSYCMAAILLRAEVPHILFVGPFVQPLQARLQEFAELAHYVGVGPD